ncbi:MAG: ammonium transporter, partial [Pseudomonadota bacterium]
MEEQLAELTAKMAELEASNAVLNTMFAETYYYLTIPLMVVIHAGFLAYEMGASRQKNVLASGIKNILAFAFMVPTFFYFGWFVYWAWTPGLLPTAESWQTGIDFANPVGEVMGPNLADNATGVFGGAVTLFAATTASIFSGAVIERIHVVG